MATKKKSARPAKAAKKPAAKKSAAKKSAAKKPVAKKPAAKKSATKKTSVSKASSSGVEAAKIISTNPVVGQASSNAESISAPSSAGKKSRSSNLLFLVIAGVVVLAVFALSNSSNDDDATPTPTATESEAKEPATEETAEPTESEGTSASLTYEAPSSFVAINNGNGGVTLRWKSPTATEGLTGYLISISYNAVDFKEVATVPVDQLTLDLSKVGDDGGTQFFIQSVYSDGQKADGAKFSLKGKYE